ncbi:hypothetical protein HK102_004896 [Quaeritorhiza haematococci]|nr:hypothetical protein HK102_004896 [Quaeritorhiza haematococci]
MDVLRLTMSSRHGPKNPLPPKHHHPHHPNQQQGPNLTVHIEDKSPTGQELPQTHQQQQKQQHQQQQKQKPLSQHGRFLSPLLLPTPGTTSPSVSPTSLTPTSATSPSAEGPSLDTGANMQLQMQDHKNTAVQQKNSGILGYFGY